VFQRNKYPFYFLKLVPTNISKSVTTKNSLTTSLQITTINMNANGALHQENGPATLTQPSTARNLVDTTNVAPASAAHPIRPINLWRFTEEDFEDIVTTWGRYDTPELVRSSPYYTKTVIVTDPGARKQFPEKKDTRSRTIHAVHPIPREDLQDMGPNCLHHLGEQLEKERWDVNRDPKFNARLRETLARMDDALEFVFRVQLPGTRLFSGREPTEL
jgi:hypothetical protein